VGDLGPAPEATTDTGRRPLVDRQAARLAKRVLLEVSYIPALTIYWFG
jgi:hypothetical protein